VHAATPQPVHRRNLVIMDPDWIEQIEAYLAGDLTEPDLREFARQQNITSVEEDIEWVRDAHTAVAMAGVRKQLNRLQSPSSREAKVRKMTPWSRIMAIAAGFLLLIFFYVVYAQMDGSGTTYQTFAYEDPGIPIQMSQSPNYRLFDALTYYSEGDYEETILQLQELQSDLPENDTLQYFLGASLLYEDQPVAARRAFEPILNTENPRFAERIQWLYVLTYLRADEPQGARTALQPILAQENHAFHDRAQALTNALD
jgi:hypothetical protein